VVAHTKVVERLPVDDPVGDRMSVAGGQTHDDAVDRDEDRCAEETPERELSLPMTASKRRC
jgi:hypothetical protein